jgi:hypothetical protein
LNFVLNFQGSHNSSFVSAFGGKSSNSGYNGFERGHNPSRSDLKEKRSTSQMKGRNASQTDLTEQYSSNLDLEHLTELQKNPLSKRIFVKNASTSNSILVKIFHLS